MGVEDQSSGTLRSASDVDGWAGPARAVRKNASHGVSTSLVDRTSAAAQLVRSHGDLSDRVIAARTGLSAATVAALRRRQSSGGATSGSRRGRDGRVRPVDATPGRRAAGRYLDAKPDASLREIARAAGISVGTARDVRARIARGEDPVLVRPRGTPAASTDAGVAVALGARADSDATLRLLRDDPAIRYTAQGRKLLRLLDCSQPATGWRDIADAVPGHCSNVVAEAARERARAWQSFAQYLENTSR
jgi:hypothetical protein